MSASATETWLSRNHFLLRRLHSLSGIVPVGLFLIMHLFTNSLAGLKSVKFDEHVHWIHSLPYLKLIEVFGIFLPLAFHAGYGAVIAMQGRANVRHYGWFDNWRYTLQRTTAWVTLLFIVVHLAHFRFAHWFGGPEYQAAIAAGTTPTDATQQMFLLVPFVSREVWLVFYVIGLVCSVYHFVNGLGTFCITWGVTIGDVARRRVLVASYGLGVVLLGWGLLSLWALNVKARPRAKEPTNVAWAAPQSAAPSHTERGAGDLKP